MKRFPVFIFSIFLSFSLFAQQLPHLSLQEAERLSALPLKCINTEFPNRLGQTLGGPEDLKRPAELHPAFYGCFDWHSSVHGHWSLVRLIKDYPGLTNAAQVREYLKKDLSKENILVEVAYFNGKHNKIYERTYGWAWLLKLAEELHTWKDPLARELESNLQPLTDLLVKKYIDFLPRLQYPIRVGEHPNTAFGLIFAWDYAHTVGNTALQKMIEQRARDFYSNDQNCPFSWEPGGYDFLSPCLEEAALMLRVMPEAEYLKWLKAFLPGLESPGFQLAPGVVSDRTDGKLVHLDGVNFSRAWCLNEIANAYPQYAHLQKVAIDHVNHSLPGIVDGNYEGGHWLGSFAIYALDSFKK